MINNQRIYPTDLTFDGLIQQLRDHLKEPYGVNESTEIFFYDDFKATSRRDEKGFLVSEIKKSDLLDLHQFELFLNELCGFKKSWINLAGDGWMGDKFLVVVAYNKNERLVEKHNDCGLPLVGI
jgi:hypothetical protein